MRATVYDQSGVLILDRMSWNPILGRFVGCLYSEYYEGDRRRLFFEDHLAARLYARGRKFKLLLREEDRPQPIAIEDMILSQSSMQQLSESEYSEFVETYGTTVIDVGLA